MKADRPKESLVWYRGAPYLLDHVACRRALVERQIEGEIDGMSSLARAVKVSRSTASRFFSGWSTSVAVTIRILSELRLAFDDVARPVSVAYVDGYLAVLDLTEHGVEARVPVLPGCTARGVDTYEATQRVAEAIADYTARLLARGLPVPHRSVLRVVQ
jgi:predicted RNase H-like HicB family nuclease